MIDRTSCRECGHTITMQCFKGTGFCCEKCRKDHEDKEIVPMNDTYALVEEPKKYRKKPVIIEAVQVTWSTWNEVCEFVGDTINEYTPAWNITKEEASDTCGEPGPNYIAFAVNTVHGEAAVVRHGDWVIPDGKPGTFYPCKPDIFKATYEEVQVAN